MGYVSAGSRYQDTESLTLSASSAKGTTANGSAVDPEGCRTASFKLDVTAVSGTSPTADVVIQCQDAAGDWHTVGTFTQAAGVTAQTIGVPITGRKVRASWTIGGTDTPLVTFSVAGEGYR